MEVGKVNKHGVRLGYMYSSQINSWHSMFKGKFSEKNGHLILSGCYRKSIFINAGKIFIALFSITCVLTIISKIYQAIHQYILYRRNVEDVEVSFLMLFAFILVYGFGFLIVKVEMAMGKEDEAKIDRALEKTPGCKVETENQ